MKKFVKLTLIVLAISIMSTGLAAEEWHTDYKKAVTHSKDTGKPIFMLFTGSDWCGWCIKLEGEILSKKAFMDYASKELILLKIDFPRRKKISEKEKMQNKELAAKYKIQGYPTIILLKDGQEKNRIGYEKYSPQKYVEFVKSKLK